MRSKEASLSTTGVGKRPRSQPTVHRSNQTLPLVALDPSLTVKLKVGKTGRDPPVGACGVVWCVRVVSACY